MSKKKAKRSSVKPRESQRDYAPKERHKVVVDYVKSIKKKTKVFHHKWKPGELIDSDVMQKTPIFWYMRYGWSRLQIETMLYKARVAITPQLANGLQEAYGGDPGPRWKGGGGVKKKKWQRSGSGVHNMYNHKSNYKYVPKKVEYEFKEKDHSGNSGKKLKGLNDKIWNAVSNFNETDKIDYKIFSDNLKERKIMVNPDISKKLFDAHADKDGYITRKQMDDLIDKLDKMKFDKNLSDVKYEDLKNPEDAALVMKEILYAAGTGKPLDINQLIMSSEINRKGLDDPLVYLGKLADRDSPWNERVKAMETIDKKLGKDKNYDKLKVRPNADALLIGYATQLLDNKPEVQKTALDGVNNIFNQIITDEPDNAIDHLEDLIDALFKILDDPNAKANHPAARKAVEKIVDDVIDYGDPEQGLYLAGLLGEKTKPENINSPDARRFALEQLNRIMFGNKSPYLIKTKDDIKKIPKIEEKKLPKKNTNNREWLDMGAGLKESPSKRMMGNEKNKNYDTTKRNKDDKNGNKKNNDDDDKKNDDNDDDGSGGGGGDGALSGKEIGDEFRQILADALGDALQDPNKGNKDIGVKYVDMMKELNPNFEKTLDPEARKAYQKKKGTWKEPKPKEPESPLPQIRNVNSDSKYTVGWKQPTLPDI